MITYTARTWEGKHLTITCLSRDAALDLAEGDLFNGITPVELEICGIQLNQQHIRRLLAKRRAQQGQMLRYVALNGYNMRIKRRFVTLEEALDEIALGLAWGLTPVSLTTTTQHYDCEGIEQLLAAQERAAEVGLPCRPPLPPRLRASSATINDATAAQ